MQLHPNAYILAPMDTQLGEFFHTMAGHLPRFGAAILVLAAFWLAGAVSALGTLGVNVTAMVAGLGLTGFAVGFAVKDALVNDDGCLLNPNSVVLTEKVLIRTPPA
jgi:hypothetical protein